MHYPQARVAATAREAPPAHAAATRGHRAWWGQAAYAVSLFECNMLVGVVNLYLNRLFQFLNAEL